ncbi:predicted protein [Naegleria gruberi]|uniref:Predicted protein n=1 Tax=Naegleria gruberi TaxID=5762 RepID=D2VE49_NAEGR|nr:uncharacterized protein NAEGRDRAFT_48808 [Naegleria gruberi]EFC44734.1 predicted protein [Naegleria gruberi]|eukprot:XP_002677478.1 predicted protein [Naegleria gruberi strain NEG-M]
MVEQKFQYNQQQCILKVMICTGEDDPLGFLLAEQLLTRGSKQFEQNPFAEALESNISPFARCVHVGLLVHPTHVESDNVKNLIQKYQSTNLLTCIVGDALEEKPTELCKKLDHYQVIVSAALRNSILHPHTQFRTEMNLIETCKLLSQQPYGIFKSFVPCQFMFDFSKLQQSMVLGMGSNFSIVWSFIQERKLIVEALRAKSIPYMVFNCGLCTDYLVEFLTFSDIIEERNIRGYGGDMTVQLYLDGDFSDLTIDCTSLKDIVQIAACKISQIGTDVPCGFQEYSFRGDRINLLQIAQSLNWKLVKLGSTKDCEQYIHKLVSIIQQDENHGHDQDKYRLAALLMKYLIGTNQAVMSDSLLTPKAKLVEKGFNFENVIHFTTEHFPISQTNPIH